VPLLCQWWEGADDAQSRCSFSNLTESFVMMVNMDSNSESGLPGGVRLSMPVTVTVTVAGTQAAG
jgi:hypothetical protein